MGLGAISATLTHKEYNSLILMYDNESYANTDIQLSGSTPLTMIWSIRAMGNAAGQLKPKPWPAAPPPKAQARLRPAKKSSSKPSAAR